MIFARLRSMALIAIFMCLAVPLSTADQHVLIEARNSADPFVAYSYNNTTVAVDLPAGRYGLVADNKAPTESSYELRQGDRVVQRHSFRYNTYGGLDVPSNASYELRLNERGQFAFVDGELANRVVNAATASLTPTFVGNHALTVFLSRGDGLFCAHSADRVTLAARDQNFDLLRISDLGEVQSFHLSRMKHFHFFLTSRDGPATVRLWASTEFGDCFRNESAPVDTTSATTPAISPSVTLFLVATTCLAGRRSRAPRR